MSKLLQWLFVKNIWVLPITSAAAIMTLALFLLDADSSLLLEGREAKAREAIEAAYGLAAKYEGAAPASAMPEANAKRETSIH